MPPKLGQFWSWQMRRLRSLARKSYRELCALPEEQQVAGPVQDRGMRFFIRRKIKAQGDKLTPKGTVEVSVCAEVYVNGKFQMGSSPSIEMSPTGKLLNSIRGWDPRD